MATDQATADQEYEQERREALEDMWEMWAECEQPQPIPQLMPAKACAQCVNWRPERLLHLEGCIFPRPTPGFCTPRAAAGLPQVPPDYAERCPFYAVEDISF